MPLGLTAPAGEGGGGPKLKVEAAAGGGMTAVALGDLFGALWWLDPFARRRVSKSLPDANGTNSSGRGEKVGADVTGVGVPNTDVWPQDEDGVTVG